MNNDELVDAMVQRLGVEIKSVMAQSRIGQVGAATLEALVRQRLWHFGAQTMGLLLEAQDAALVGDRAVHDRPTRTIVTLFGDVDITRSRCADGSYPLDDALQLQGRHGWTAAVQEAVSLLSCDSVFETVCDLMKHLLGVSISRSRAQEVAEQAGQRAGELRPPALASAEHDACGKTLVLETDGCQAPFRDGWHEVKVGVIYVNESRAKTAGGRGKVLAKEYLGSVEPVTPWAMQFRQAAESWQVQNAKRVVVMGDGAPWIWNLADEQFPQAIQIVDYYHAVEHLWGAAEALWGDRETSALTRSWARHHRRQLKKGRVDLVMAALERARTRPGLKLSQTAATTVRRNLEYFQTNRQRMQYDRYRRLKLAIGTGAVEGSCKFVVQSRFKKPGARWSKSGLKQMLDLKLSRLNRQWDTLWPHLRLTA